MRFRKGNRVEVMNREEGGTSWRFGKIISRNGHKHNICLNYCLNREVFVERVSRKVIRPCPPPVEGSQKWMVGDIVEVFDDHSWKAASILEVYGRGYYLVSIVGLSQEFKVHKLDIRIRLSWESDEWVVIGTFPESLKKDFKSCNPSLKCCEKTIFQTLHANAKTNLQREEIYLAVEKKDGLQESQSRRLKRSSPIHDVYSGNLKKRRATEGGGRDPRVAPIPLSKGYIELETESSDACSVGSCSVLRSYNSNKSSSHFVEAHCRETDTACSDAESIYRLELDAYRWTIGALYTSGPLTWEKESLLTNLRFSLHISNDELLLE